MGAGLFFCRPEPARTRLEFLRTGPRPSLIQILQSNLGIMYQSVQPSVPIMSTDYSIPYTTLTIDASCSCGGSSGGSSSGCLGRLLGLLPLLLVALLLLFAFLLLLLL